MKLRALAVTAAVLTVCAGALASGCKDDETTPTPTTDAGRDGRSPTDPPTGEGTCPAAVVTSLLAWKTPAKTKDNACQQDDIDAMRDFLNKEPNATNEDFENFVKNRDTVCHDCMFGDATGATWPPFPIQDGKVVTFNIGSCYALVSGKEGCGKAIQNEFDCEFVACADCTSEDELNTCRKKARTTVCATVDALTRSECAGVPVRVDDVCGSIFDSVRVQCISLTAEPPDGGTDAGDGG